MANDKTFVRITNQDIYDVIKEMKDSIVSLKEANAQQHGQIIIHQKHTNGKVKLNRWVASTALAIVCSIAGINFI